MVQPSQQHVAICVKGVERGLGTGYLRMVVAFWAVIPVEVTEEAGVVPRCTRVAIGDTLLVASYDTQENSGHIVPHAHRGHKIEITLKN